MYEPLRGEEDTASTAGGADPPATTAADAGRPAPAGVSSEANAAASVHPTQRYGHLYVTLKDAVLVKNYGLVKMDPFCLLKVGHTVLRSRTHEHAGTHPQWNQTFRFTIKPGRNIISVEVLDERVLSDKQVATAHIDLDDAFKFKTVEKDYPLSGKQGHEGVIRLGLTYVYGPPAPEPVQQLVYIDDPWSFASPYQTVISVPATTYVTAYGVAPAAVPVVIAAAPGPVAMPMPQPPPVDRNAGRARLEADCRHVKELFPAMDDEVIKSVLIANRGNIDNAVSQLLEMNGGQQGTTAAPSATDASTAS